MYRFWVLFPVKATNGGKTFIFTLSKGHNISTYVLSSITVKNANMQDWYILHLIKGVPILAFCRYAETANIGHCRYANIADIFLCKMINISLLSQVVLT